MAEDNTHKCSLRSDGRPTRARRRKESTCPELVGRHTRARLTVMGVEVGGRFSTGTQSFLPTWPEPRPVVRTRSSGKGWSRLGGSDAVLLWLASQHVLLLPAFWVCPADGDTTRDYGMR